MTNDLVKRLREYGDWPQDVLYREWAEWSHKAANRIEKLESALRKIKDLHDRPGPEDEQVIEERDDRTYFIVCEALEGKDG